MISKLMIYFLFLPIGVALAAPVINVVSPLNFPDSGPQQTVNITVAPADSGAAVFSVTGGVPNAPVTCTFGSASVVMITGAGSGTAQKITANAWTKNCPATFDASGNMTIRVGARAVQSTNDISGPYTISTQSIILTY